MPLDLCFGFRITGDVFCDECMDCIRIVTEGLACVRRGSLTVAQGQIRIGPGPKEKIKAFIQWTCDQFLMGQDPANSPFPVTDTRIFLRHYKTMEHFKAKAKRMAELAKPQPFRTTTRWEDWYPSFLLRHQPGRDGVPLPVVCLT